MYIQRQNLHLVKQGDEGVIAIHILHKFLGFTSEQPSISLSLATSLRNRSFLNAPNTIATLKPPIHEFYS